MRTADRLSRPSTSLALTASTLLAILAGAACAPALVGPGSRAVVHVVSVMASTTCDIVDGADAPPMAPQMAMTRGETPRDQRPALAPRLLDLPPPADVLA